MHGVRLALAIVWWLALTPLGAIAAEDIADELKRIAGRYERSFTNNAGTTFRTIKEIDGDQESVTTFDDVGNVVLGHTSTFKVEKRGPVRVFSFFNAIATAGPHKGERNFETASYIYRADDEHFAEVWGILDGDKSAPRMLIWKRIKDTK